MNVWSVALVGHQCTFNEVKVMNPTFQGLGVFRRGQPVMFEGLDTPARLKSIFGEAFGALRNLCNLVKRHLAERRFWAKALARGA